VNDYSGKTSMLREALAVILAAKGFKSAKVQVTCEGNDYSWGIDAEVEA
jgi:recombinational DNA repair ATPase RecF